MNLLAAFPESAFSVSHGKFRVFTHVSEGSGKEMYLHSCPNCASTVFIKLERFPGFVGVMTGTLDNPNWFDRSPENSKYIFTSSAQKGTLVQAGFPVFEEHATKLDGGAITPIVFDQHCLVRE